ncbi:MAG TPA: hypothetical protein VJT32_16860 [bacterium]|nr:hypothetical protein [bacterium]
MAGRPRPAAELDRTRSRRQAVPSLGGDLGSRKTGFVHLKIEPEPRSHDWTLALDALTEFGLKQRLTGYRPGRLEVADGELGVRLLEAIGDQDLALTALPDLPAVRRVLAEMAERMAGAPLPPNALDAAGVTVDRIAQARGAR